VAGDEAPEPDLAQLARRLRPGCKKHQRILAGWYDPTDGVHHPYDVLIAQEQNLAWNARFRRRYATLVLAAA
jgi:SMODS-associating 4TM effector domain